MRSSASGRVVGFRFILLILVSICLATSGADIVSGSGAGSASSMDMVQHRLAAESEPKLLLETNTLSDQLLRIIKVLETIGERAHRLRNDSRCLRDQITGARVHLRSVVSEQPRGEMAQQQAELQAGLAAMRAAVDAGKARLEASYRSQDVAVDRLREMWRRLQLDFIDNGKVMRALEEIILVHDAQFVSILQAQQELTTLRAKISAALDHVLVLSHYSAAPSYNYSSSYN